jgi:O-antigen ligase
MTAKPLSSLFDPLRNAMVSYVPGSINVIRVLLSSSLVFACVLVGLMVAVLPYWFTIAIAVVPIFFLLVAWRLEYGVLAVLALVSGIVHEAFLPSLSLLRAGDLSFFAVVAITIASGCTLTQGFRRSELKLWIPFVAFLLLVPVSVVHSYFLLGLSPKDVFGEGRHLMFLLLFPLTVAVLNTKERLRRFVLGLLLLGVLFSMGQIVQSFFHVRIFGDSGRLVIAETLGVKSYDATISNTGGLNIIILVLFTSVGWYALKEIKTFKFLSLSAICAVGILLTFGRTTWGVTLLGLAVVMYLLGLRKSGPVLVWSLVASALAFALLIAFKPAMLDALIVRATSVEKEVEYGSSAAWRYYEAEQVLPQIAANPILGLGLGAAYRAPARSDALPEQVRYVHNGYLYMASKLGVPALALFVWCIGIILRWSWRGAQTERDPRSRGVHAAIFAGVLGVLMASITEPHPMRDSSLAFLGVLAGLTVALQRHARTLAPGEDEARAAITVGAVLLKRMTKAEHV